MEQLAFAGEIPASDDPSRRWHAMLVVAREIVDILPLAHLGQRVLTLEGHLFQGGRGELRPAVDVGQLTSHTGRIGGLAQLKT